MVLFSFPFLPIAVFDTLSIFILEIHLKLENDKHCDVLKYATTVQGMEMELKVSAFTL